MIVKIKADLSDYQQKLDQMGKQTVSASDKVKSALSGASAAYTKAGLAIAGFTAGAVKSAMDWGISIKALSRQTGMSAEETSKFLVVAKRAGIDIDSARTIFARFAVNVTQAGKEMARAAAEGKASDDSFTRLGVSVRNADGTYRSINEIFDEVRDKLSRMENGADKTTIQMDLFGRSGYQLAGIMGMTREEMQQTIDRAKALGLVLSDEQANAWAKAGKDIKEVKQTLTSVGIVVGTQLLPYIKAGTTDIVSWTRAFANMDGQNKETIITITKLTAEVGGFIWTANKIVTMSGPLRAALKNPWIGIPALIIAAVGAIWDYNRAMDAAMKRNPRGTMNLYSDDMSREIANSQNPPSAADFKRSEDTNNLPAWGTQEQTDTSDNSPFVPAPVSTGGGGGGGSEKSKTELQAYTEEMQKLISVWEKEVELGQLSRDEFQRLLQERLAGLSAIGVDSEEVLTRRQEELNLMLQIRQAGEQSRQQAIEEAQQQQQLGNITNEQLAETISKQYEVAESDQERIKILLQLKNVYNDLKKAADEYYDAVMARQEEEAREINKDLEEKTSKYTSDYQFDLSLEKKKVGNKSAFLQKLLEDHESYLKRKNDLSGEEALQEAAQDTVRAEAIKQVNHEILSDQVDAAVRSREVWANNLADIITNTRSAHDILKQQWRDFVAQIIMEQMKINIGSNIFGAIFGIDVGGNKKASGGYIKGPGTDTSDSIPSMLSNGEYVIKASSVRKYGKGFFDMLNAGNMLGFATGGMVDLASYAKPIIPDASIASGQVLDHYGGQLVKNTSVVINQTFNGQQNDSVVAQIRSQKDWLIGVVEDAMRNKTSTRNAVRGASR